MTQLTVSIQDISMLDQIRQAISLLRGVTSVTMKRQTKTGMDRAIEDIKKGRVYEADSVENLIKQCKA
jgi:hypothetical protein